MGKRDKWKKYKVLREVTSLQRHIPATRKFNKKQFRGMLQMYRGVIVKPKNGFGGAGVVLVRKKKGTGRYVIHDGKKIKHVTSKKKAYRWVRRRRKTGLIVQQYIRLAAIKKRPFDLRVMVQRRTKRSKWEVTGKLVKVAGKGYIVTNVRRSRGKVTSVHSAISKSDIRNKQVRKIKKNIDRVSLLCAKVLGRYYPSIRTVGMDIGLDRNGKVWVIEANFTPDLLLFRKLKNQSAYKKIVMYKKGS